MIIPLTRPSSLQYLTALGVASALLTGCNNLPQISEQGSVEANSALAAVINDQYERRLNSLDNFPEKQAGVEANSTLSVRVNHQDINEQAELKTFQGDTIQLQKNKISHLVFMDIWASYGGEGAETDVAQLPEHFLKSSQQIWVQPEINVTPAQMAEFQGYYPQVTPFVLDKSFKLMRANGVWQSPYHVLREGDKTLYAGDFSGLKRYLNIAEGTESTNNQITQSTEGSEAQEKSAKANKTYQKLNIGDIAPKFMGTTLKGKTIDLQQPLNSLDNKPVSLVFVDSLCPMPHFPGCEQKLAQLNKNISASPNRQWIGIVSSFYVDQDFVSGFSERFQLQLPLIFDQDNQIFEQYGVHATPYQIDISRNGTIQSRGDLMN